MFQERTYKTGEVEVGEDRLKKYVPQYEMKDFQMPLMPFQEIPIHEQKQLRILKLMKIITKNNTYR